MIERVTTGIVTGYLHRSPQPDGSAVVLSHGAGSNANSRLLTGVAAEFATRGTTALRIDLPFRQVRTVGPPHPAAAAKDREGIRAAAAWLMDEGFTKIYLGGHSYGGRQTSMLVAESPEIAGGILLLSYPLHPPRRPEQLRTGHFPSLHVPTLFIHGSRDPFGSPDELRSVVPSQAEVYVVDSAGHELKPVVQQPALAVDEFFRYLGSRGVSSGADSHSKSAT
jgi:predicted alpha/beta-hydrolase family hydrolase